MYLNTFLLAQDLIFEFLSQLDSILFWTVFFDLLNLSKRDEQKWILGRESFLSSDSYKVKQSHLHFIFHSWTPPRKSRLLKGRSWTKIWTFCCLRAWLSKTWTGWCFGVVFSVSASEGWMSMKRDQPSKSFWVSGAPSLLNATLDPSVKLR